MTDLRQEVETNGCIVGRIVEPDYVSWRHCQNDRRKFVKDN